MSYNPQQMVAMMEAMGITPNDLASAGNMFGVPSSSPSRPPPLSYNLPEAEIRRNMELLEAWQEEEQRLPPVKAPVVNRHMLIANLSLQRKHKLSKEHHIRQTILGSAKHSSQVPLSELRRVTFSEMLVRKTHKGCYLLCRSVAPCDRMVALQLAVEDTHGAVQNLSIYNYPSANLGSSQDDNDALFPTGVIMAIREPTFKMATQGPYPIVRVDSPTDIYILDDEGELLKGVQWKTGKRVPSAPTLSATAEEWKALGNQHFNTGLWLASAQAYTRGLLKDPSAYIFRLNRAEAYIRLEYYSAGLLDAESVLDHAGLEDSHPHRVKALSRAVRASYGKGQYSTCERYATRWLVDDKTKEAQQWIGRCQSRHNEQEVGDYDWIQMFKDAQKSPHIHVADFRGPIEIKGINGRGGGRGVVAERDIAVGELLVVAKPFASAFASDLPKNETLLSHDLISKTLKSGTQTAVLGKIIEKLWGNPDLRGLVFDLYAGPKFSERRREYIATPVPLTTDSFPSQFPLYPALDLDIAELEAIISYNAFSPNDHATRSASNSKGERTSKDPSALYTLPSLFNHACVSNASWSCIGDVMVVRATVNINKGQEIILAYVSPTVPYERRQKIMKQFMIPNCNCAVCLANQLDGNAMLARRQTLSDQFYKVCNENLKTKAAALPNLQRIFKEIEGTYINSQGAFHPEMFGLHCALAESLRYQTRGIQGRTLETAVASEFNALRCVGVTVIDDSTRGKLKSPALLPISTELVTSSIDFRTYIKILISIAFTFQMIGDLKRVKHWLKAAAYVSKLTVGGGKDLFLFQFRSSLDNIGLLELASSSV